ncbi:MAG: hypothetical protein EPO21_17600 [Chloroflexota bacterium]|nr:MAG: hypothetical protein EPO21_17600 [Chloroflexota bacterium]
MQERHAVAATFTDRKATEDCIREMEAQGIKDDAICVLLPRGVSAEEFKSTTGVEREAAGGGLLDRLASLVGRGADCLSDFGIAGEEQDYLKDCRDRGEYVVAVKCDGMCANIHPIVSRYGGHLPASEGYGTEDYYGQDILG